MSKFVGASTNAVTKCATSKSVDLAYVDNCFTSTTSVDLGASAEWKNCFGRSAGFFTRPSGTSHAETCAKNYGSGFSQTTADTCDATCVIRKSCSGVTGDLPQLSHGGGDNGNTRVKHADMDKDIPLTKGGQVLSFDSDGNYCRDCPASIHLNDDHDGRATKCAASNDWSSGKCDSEGLNKLMVSALNLTPQLT